MHWLAKPGTGHQEMVRTTELVNRELLTIPGVRNAGSHIGQALLMDEVVGIDFGENWVSVDPSVDHDQTVDRIQEVVDGYPGLFRDVLTYLKERIREVLTGSSEAITVRLYGQDLELLREKASEIDDLLGSIPGVVENHVDFQEDVPQIKVEVILAAAKQFGLKPGDVRRAAAMLIAGEEAGDVFQGGRAYDVQVWSTPETRQTLTDIENLLLDTPTGQHVLLSDVAEVSIVPTPNIIRHEGLFRSIDVGANVDGSRDLGSVVAEFERRLAEVEMPPEFRAELLGEFTERQAAQRRLLIFSVAAAIGVLMLLQASFQSWRLATLTFLTLPIALVGGALAAFVGGGVISLGSLVGFLTVLGIVARNGIMLISHYQHLERVEGMEFGPDLVLRGAQERVVPIMMTVLTTGLALVPLIVAGQIPGQEIEHPMAIVILGGLITATLLNLFVVPSLYLRFGKPRSTRPSGTVLAAGALLALIATACTTGPAPDTAAPQAGAPVAEAPRPQPSQPAAAPVPSVPTVSPTEPFDRRNFTDPTTIDNRWLPLRPGTRLVTEGEATVDGERIGRRVMLTVTDLTKVIDGVPTVVAHEVDWNDEEIVEAELIFFAQDDAGNVWHMGQYPEEYEAGTIVDTPAWIHDLQGAAAGIFMQAVPQLGTPSYSQGWGPEVGWTDRGEVVEVGRQTCVPVSCYTDVLVVREFNETEPNAFQLKSYALDVGSVEVGWGGAGEVEQEVLRLVERVQLTPEEMGAVRAEAFALEERAYASNHVVYKYTAPIEQAP
jgi:hypothetical protein